MAGTLITVAHGDGIGPEIMDATLFILREAVARVDIDTIEVGEKVYQRGVSVGIEPSAWQSLRRTKVFLKAPITTPQGGGFKSLNVTTRKTGGGSQTAIDLQSKCQSISRRDSRFRELGLSGIEQLRNRGLRHREIR